MEVKCKRCGSTNVEVRTWVNPNTMEASSLIYMDLSDSDFEDSWCKDCDDNTDLVVEDKDDSNDNLLADIEIWWNQIDDEDREVITGLDDSDFSSIELYEAKCNDIWKGKTDEQKIEIFRTINYRE